MLALYLISSPIAVSPYDPSRDELLVLNLPIDHDRPSDVTHSLELVRASADGARYTTTLLRGGEAECRAKLAAAVALITHGAAVVDLATAPQ